MADGEVPQEELWQNLQLQMTEIEMLESMFPNPGEFEFSDPPAAAECRSLATGSKLSFIPLSLEFYLRMKLEEVENRLEVLVNFPHGYPATSLPEIYVRCCSLVKHKHRQLNEDLRKFIGGLALGDLCIGQVIQWLQENAANYISKDTASEKNLTKVLSAGPVTFKRLWIYSHHIYSKIKRRNMIDLASDLDLTGFTLPGKPGVICVEGYDRNVDDFWSRVRNWTWKRISLKYEEVFNSVDINEANKLRKFDGFEEKAFNVRKLYSREYTQDLGLFYQFLQERQLGFVFKEYFGVEGKQAQ